jgi:hypothetical protein
MTTNNFVEIAETRADHLRQLSQHERALEWINASLAEVESEIPDLELAMAVYRRLNPSPADVAGSGQPAFLGIAGVRADHLRQLSHHMRALNWVSAPLAEIETEIPDLEKALAVYRRLVPGEGGSESTSSSSSSGSSRSSRSRSTASDTSEEAASPPSFKEYALQHLDSGDSDEGNGANASA